MKKTTQYAVMASIVAALALTTTAHASRNQDVERQVRSYFKDIPVMVRIAKCESGFRHYDPRHPSGLLTNPSPRSSATGVLQILLKTHGPNARRLGFDLKTVKGQLGYAKHLYKQNGTRDWNASRSCWS